MSVREKARSAVKWAYLGDILPRIVNPLITLVLAGLLTPTDYGVVGIVITITGLVRIIQNMGLGEAVIQTDENLDESLNTIFWCNFMLSLGLYLLLYIVAPTLSYGFNEPGVKWALRVAGLALIISAFDSVQDALLRRSFRFAELFWRRLIPSLVPIIVTLPLAIIGGGYWSLITGNLLGNGLGVIFLWRTSRWRPRITFNWTTARTLFSFGVLVSVESLLRWGIRYGDRFFVGYFLSIEQLGYYTFALNVVNLAREGLITPLSRVAYPTLSRLRANPVFLIEKFVTAMRVFFIFAFFITFGIAILAEPGLGALYGEKWNSAAPIISVLAIGSALGWGAVLYQDLFRALGKPEINVKSNALAIMVAVPFLILSSKNGLLAFAAVRASVDIILYIVCILASVKVIHFPKWHGWQVLRIPLLGAAMMLALTLLIGEVWVDVNYGRSAWLLLVFTGISALIVYATVIWIFERTLFLQLLRFGYKKAGFVS